MEEAAKKNPAKIQASKPFWARGEGEWWIGGERTRLPSLKFDQRWGSPLGSRKKKKKPTSKGKGSRDPAQD